MTQISLGKELNLHDLLVLAQKGNEISLHADNQDLVRKSYAYLQNHLSVNHEPVYGINTGFGSLYNTVIDKADLSDLQYNLLVSHACGMGNPVEPAVIRLMLALKVHGLSKGNSGVSPQLIDRLIYLYNHEYLPVVYELGSLGASGDLSPLAHLSLPLIGLGEIHHHGKTLPSTVIPLSPLELQAKEGLALINGTQYMASVLAFTILECQRLADWADALAALSLDAFDGKISPFHPSIHQIRPHKGQQTVAQNIRRLLEGSELIDRPKKHVQDPYSFRCVPQVHGSSRDVISHVEEVLLTEINGVTDNPNIFPDEDLILSGGNFHGQTLALNADFLSLAIHELGHISERRIYQLISGQRDLPAFLTPKPGLHSGYMIPQYTAASIVNRNKVLCTPASIDSIVSSNGQEDHVSMGATSVNKCLEITRNTRKILAIELMIASQALSFREPSKTSPILEELLSRFRKKVPVTSDDAFMHERMIDAEYFVTHETLN